MLSRSAYLLIRACLMGLVAALITGCYLRFLTGSVLVTEDAANFVDDLFAAIDGHSTVAVCNTFFGEFQCEYYVNGMSIVSTASIFSEFGHIYGTLIDPVIVQAPDDAISVTATYSNAGSLIPAITRIQSSFEYMPHLFITAQTGTKFLILDVPDDITATINTTDPVNGPRLDFALRFHQFKPISETVKPVDLKLMLTAKVNSRGRIYFAPMLPCVTDFALVPTITLPITSTPVSLESQFEAILQNNQAQPCNHKYYDYTGTPPLSEVWLPFMVR